MRSVNGTLPFRHRRLRERARRPEMLLLGTAESEAALPHDGRDLFLWLLHRAKQGLQLKLRDFRHPVRSALVQLVLAVSTSP